MIKRAGFVFGAIVAAIGVMVFNSWRHVSDDDRLALLLGDHCLPYVVDGTAPFDGLGRSPGVYDAVDLRDGVADGGAKVLYDNRFVAQWGVMDNMGLKADTTVRFCDVNPSFGENTVAGFAVDPDGFVARYTGLIAQTEPLVPEVETLTSGPRTMGWFGADRAFDEGLRVVMIASPGLVSSLSAVTNLPD